MGILSWLFGEGKKRGGVSSTSLSQARKPSPISPQNQQPRKTYRLWPWKLPETVRRISVDGPLERKVYVYDGAPLRNIRIGESFVIEAYPGSAQMESVYTGMVWKTDDSTLVTYKGKPIGFTNIPIEETKELAKRGIVLTMTAKCIGMVDGYDGVKDIRYGVFDYIHVMDVLALVSARDAGAPLDAKRYKFSEHKKAPLETFSPHEFIAFPDARIEYIRGKGDAKPRIRVTSSDGRIITEVGPTWPYYHEWSEHIAAGSKVHATASLEYLRPMSYSVTIYCW